MVKSKIIRNASFVSSGAVIGKILALATLYFTSRLLGPNNFGSYNFAVVYAGYFALLADFGTTQVMIIKGAQQPENRSRLFWQIAYFRLIVGLVIALVLILTAYVVTNDAKSREAIIISSLAIPIGNMAGLLGAFFVSDQMHNFKVIIETIVAILITGLTILLLFLGYGYVSLILIGLIGTLCIAVVQYKYLRRHGLDSHIKADISDIIQIVKKASPFGAIIFFNNLFSRVDIALIQYMLGSESVGIYSAAYKLMNNVAFIPGAVTSAMLPVMSIMTANNSDQIGRLLKRSVTLLLAIGLPIAALTTIWGADFVRLYFGSSYYEAIKPLVILGWAVPVMFVNSVFIHLFYAQNKLKDILMLVLVLVAVNAGINLVLLHMLGIVGAAIATVVCECIAISYYLIKMRIPFPNITNKLPTNVILTIGACTAAITVYLFMRVHSAFVAKSTATIIVLYGFWLVTKREGLLEMVFKRKHLSADERTQANA